MLTQLHLPDEFLPYLGQDPARSLPVCEVVVNKLPYLDYPIVTLSPVVNNDSQQLGNRKQAQNPSSGVHDVGSPEKSQAMVVGQTSPSLQTSQVTPSARTTRPLSYHDFEPETTRPRPAAADVARSPGSPPLKFVRSLGLHGHLLEFIVVICGLPGLLFGWIIALGLVEMTWEFPVAFGVATVAAIRKTVLYCIQAHRAAWSTTHRVPLDMTEILMEEPSVVNLKTVLVYWPIISGSALCEIYVMSLAAAQSWSSTIAPSLPTWIWICLIGVFRFLPLIRRIAARRPIVHCRLSS